ncbi:MULTISPECIES: MCE family protein [Mycolicibacterium]|uniref:Virulence factor Mce family protein n=2 Tax=Mycolicibacterium gilvum TaxID=1804 RepID=E6THA7_MYCSR|nr:MULTISPECIES: MCE family protein [Mycolicibacterium]ABP46630.1 virulence factor Mce family protein [Mycolicibacterium gilvum PYR-GCK]ADU00115.1 virulence factor Mce family protein [Mycolicibacterium gilvum Spyr1]MBV5242756.1 MCE family protein [Mycolicibacterium sp. PAM1]
MRRQRGAGLKFALFVTVMALLTGCLFAVFGQYRSGSTNVYSAVFKDVSNLRAGESVRFAGVRIGTVKDLSMQPDKTVVVTFDAERGLVLTSGTRAVVRYLNLVGDRFLELVDDEGSTRILPAGARIPVEQTAPALDLDLLLGGLKPVIKGLDAQEVNNLSAALIQIVQGQGGTLESLLSRTSSFSNALADRTEVIDRLIVNLQTTLGTLADQRDDFSEGLTRLHRLVTELSAERQPIGAAIDSLSAGTASLSDLLTDTRPPLADTVDQLHRLAPNLESKLDRLETAISKAPENYRKLVRIGSYGSFVNYYICSLGVRVTDLAGRTAVFPVFRQDNGRCAEN